MIFDRISSKYVGLAFTYGFTRKLVYTHNQEYKEIDFVDLKKIVKKTPILYTDRLIFATLAGCRSIITSPIEIIRDIRYLEKKYRNIKEDKIETNVDYVSVMFSID